MAVWRLWMSLVLGLGVAGCSGEAKQPKSDAELAAEAKKIVNESGPPRHYLVWSKRADGAAVTALVTSRGVVGRKDGVIVYGMGEGFRASVSEEPVPPCAEGCADAMEGCPSGDGWIVSQLALTPIFRRTGPTLFAPFGAPKQGSPNESYKDKLEILSVTRDHIFVRSTSERYICGADGASGQERVYAVGLDGQESSFVAGVGAEAVAAHGAAIVKAAGTRHQGFELSDARLTLADAWPVWSGAQPTWMYGFDGSCGERCSGMVDQEQPLRVEVPAASPPQRAVKGEETPAAVAASWAADGAALGWAEVVLMSDEERTRLEQYFR
jgi:hypothetical protein